MAATRLRSQTIPQPGQCASPHVESESYRRPHHLAAIHPRPARLGRALLCPAEPAALGPTFQRTPLRQQETAAVGLSERSPDKYKLCRHEAAAATMDGWSCPSIRDAAVKQEHGHHVYVSTRLLQELQVPTEHTVLVVHQAAPHDGRERFHVPSKPLQS